ncbi:Type II/IV secretion system protein [Candidatus Tiddalikarchaeum anstoanum]|nr:Type II/IV secretion system protein [Candidatus Tiddalikarchaeum anstoanum]
MVEFNLRGFIGFNALEINCNNCVSIASLENPKCIECVNSLNLSFDLLELVKKYSKVYYEKGLSSSLLHDNFHVFEPVTVPSFIKFYLVPNKAANESTGTFTFKDIEGSPLMLVNPKEYMLNYEDLELLNSVVEKVQNEEIEKDNIEKLLPKDKLFLVPLVIRYTSGLGIVEEFLSDDNVQDIFINSPGNSRLFVNHSSKGNLATNVYLKNEMVNKIGTFLRINSGRPFDEAFPVIHSNIGTVNARICGVSQPLSFNGTGFAIRKHTTIPLTLNRMLYDGFLSASVAGLLWFLIDNRVSIIITGPRGSGKTSLLGSLMFELPYNLRLIVIEDTPELPVNHLRNLGFNLEHLKTVSFEGSESFELSPETVLRTALRLGDSALIIGEVRGTEAKTLFEAMRVGAAGSSVLGTIHGNTAFDTFDRVVNDLGVPPTSFKACDIVVSCSNLELGDKTENTRKLVRITEVGKNWINNPAGENGFSDLVIFDSSTNKYNISKLGVSPLLNKIAYTKGVSVKKLLDNINLRIRIKEAVLRGAKKGNISLLSPESSLKQNEEFSKLVSSNDYDAVYRKFCSFIKSEPLEYNLTGDEEVILKALSKVKAFSEKKAVKSNILFAKLPSKMSRAKFNTLLANLEDKGVISCTVNRGWFTMR